MAEKNLKILGIDPGLQVTGYAVLAQSARRVKVLDAGVFRTDAKGSLPERLVQLYSDINDLLTEHRPDCMAIEELYAHYGHPRTAILMGHARGVFLLAAAQHNIPVHDYAATRVKKSLTGAGRAGKQQMQRAVMTQLNLARLPEPADVADALAIALCAMNELGREASKTSDGYVRR
ncbi:MAG: crossover junction endodeoxyribonuclease RuvC [Sedimentisphaerales bacterium]|nr:crossover junction endodeoxyribonuclease RuvC [Sedimentisphaerales bacterium]